MTLQWQNVPPWVPIVLGMVSGAAIFAAGAALALLTSH